MDPDIKALLSILLESENRLTERTIDLTARMIALTGTLDGFIAASDAYVKASNERITLVEKQLDAFLRAIQPKPNGS